MKLKRFYFVMACAFMILISGTAMAQPQSPLLSVTNGRVTYLSWTEVTGATGYTLSFAPTFFMDPASTVSVDMETQRSLSGELPEGTAFYVAVQARDDTGVSQYSNVVLVGDDGTILKQIIFFGRHSIRSSTSDPSSLAQFAVDSYPDFVGVQKGYLTPRGQQAASLLGSYFHDYLLNEGFLTGDAQTDLSCSYFRANSIQRSNITAAKFGEGLIPCATIPVHSYRIADGNTRAEPDPVFDPILANVATVDPVRAVTEVQGIFGSGTATASAYSGELSLIRSVLYPPETQPTTGALQGSVDPTSLPITLTASTSIMYTGGVINVGGLNSIASAADPFIMQYADNFPLDDVAWGRLSLDALSQQTRIINLFFNIELLAPYLNQVQSSNAASHVLRTMEQAVIGDNMPGAFGDPGSRLIVIISSDAYVVGLAGLLKMHWMLPGYQPDYCPPGGALVFELRQLKSSQEYLVRAFFISQTLDQLRNLTPLTLENPPAKMQLLIPGGSVSATDLDVNFNTFENILTEAIDQKYVQPYGEEVPPGVISGVPLE
jgi:4-phytase / acid phosphatase